METQPIINSLGIVGEKVSQATAWIIVQISTFGVSIGVNQAKIISLILILALLFVTIKFIHFARKPIKWGIIILLILLLTSIGLSFIK